MNIGEINRLCKISSVDKGWVSLDWLIIRPALISMVFTIDRIKIGTKTVIHTQSFPALHAKFLSSRQPCPPWPAIITILYKPTRAGFGSRLIFPISDPRGAILCPLNFENGPAVLLRPVPSFWLPNVALFLLQMPSSLCVQNCISTGFDSFPRADWLYTEEWFVSETSKQWIISWGL